MKKEALSKLLIVDSEYYDYSASYVGFLSKNNLKTIEQLFEVFNKGYHSMNIRSETYRQLRCFVSMLKYKYLNEPLCYDICLDRDITQEYHGGKFVFENVLNRQDRITILNMFGCRSEIIVYAFNMFLKENLLVAPDNFKIIDFFRWIVSNSERKQFAIIASYAKTYVESYEKGKELEKNDYETIVALKSQLESLVATRNNLEQQIEDIQEKIDKLSYDKENGR